MGLALAVILTGGHILTLSPSSPVVSTVAIENERIVYVGDQLAAAHKAIRGQATVLDLRGRTVIPGFNDAHLHFALATTLGSDDSIEINQEASEKWRQAVRQAANRMVPNSSGWLFVQSRRLPPGISTAKDLDFIARPLFVVTAHGGLCNHAAVKQAFSSAEAPEGFVQGGLLAFAFERIFSHLPETCKQTQAALFLKRLAEVGITSAQSMGDQAALFEPLRRSGKLTARLRFVPFGRQFDTLFGFSDFQAEAPLWLRAAGIKYFHDDAARLARFELGRIFDALTERKNAPDQMVVHILSRRALSTFLDALERAARKQPTLPSLVRLEHLDEATQVEADRLARLHIPVCTNPAMIPEWNLKTAFPLRTLADAGVALCFGSDWVGRHQPERPLQPLWSIARAIEHVPEAVTALEALTAYTVGSAAAEGLAAEKGSLEVGKLGDLLVLSEDFTVTRAPEKTAVLATFVGGRLVHLASALGRDKFWQALLETR